jgi:hypothetical protein
LAQGLRHSLLRLSQQALVLASSTLLISRQRALPQILAVLAAAMVLAATPRGIGTNNDSPAFFGAARSLLAGQGLRSLSTDGELVPLSHWPPGYPLILAAAGSLGGDLLHVARVVNAAAVGLTVMFSTALILRATGSGLFALMGGVTIATSDAILLNGVMAVSEPLFLLLVAAVLALLVSGRLGLAAAVAGASVLVRFAGLPLVVTVATLALVSESGWRRVWYGTKLLVVGLVPYALWLAYEAQQDASWVSAALAWHPPSTAALGDGLATLSTWFAPLYAPLVPLALLVLLPTLAVLPGFRSASSVTRRLVRAAGLFAAFYVPFVVLTMSFLYASTNLEKRILAPLYLVWAVAFFALLAETVHFWRRPFVRALPAGIAAAFVVSGIVFALALIPMSRHEGIGFSSRAWRDSPTMAYVEALPDDAIIYSDAAGAIYFLSGRLARSLPVHFSPYTLAANSSYEVEVIAIGRAVGDGAVLVDFDIWPTGGYKTDPRDIAAALALEPVLELADGVVYGRGSKSP